MATIPTYGDSRQERRIPSISPPFYLPLAANQEHDYLATEVTRRQRGPIVSSSVPFCVVLRGPLDEGRLESALNILIGRHAALRLHVFPNQLLTHAQREASLLDFSRGGGWVRDLFLQSVETNVGMKLHVFDLSAASLDQKHKKFLEIAESEASGNFAGPQRVRATLVRFANEEHTLLVNIDHSVADGWSAGALFSELHALYAEAVGEHAGNVPSVSVSFADFAVWQRRAFSSGTFESELRYWRAQWSKFGGSRVSLEECPFVRSPPKNLWTQYATVEQKLCVNSEANLAALLKATRTTLYMIAVAAYVALLGRLLSRDAIALWGFFSNREQPGLQDAVGYFMNKHLLGFEIPMGQSVISYVKQVRNVILDAISNQSLPLPHLWQTLGVRPLMHDAALLVDVTPTSPLLLTKRVQDLVMTAEWYPEVPRRRWSPLMVSIAKSGTTTTLRATFATEIFDSTSIEFLLSRMGRVVSRFADSPRESLSELTKDLAAVNGYPATGTMGRFIVSGWERLPIAPNRGHAGS